MQSSEWCLLLSSLSCIQLFCDPMNCSLPGSSVHGILQARNTAVGCHSLLQCILTTQGLNAGLLRCGQILSYQGNREGKGNAISER